MAYSMSFNGVDLSTYGLVVVSAEINRASQEPVYVRLPDKAYPFTTQRGPRVITIDFRVVAATRAILDSYLDSIKQTITTDTPGDLIRDTLNGRYWEAILDDFDGGYYAPGMFRGMMTFLCPDARAHAVTQTSSDFNIDADPDTVVETTGGTAYIEPVYTLTAGENLVAVTIKVENTDTSEELQWTGSLANGEELEIDVPNWIVNKEGIADMATVTGEFPRLKPGQNNSIKVTAFSTTGTLNITYRDRYL